MIARWSSPEGWWSCTASPPATGAEESAEPQEVVRSCGRAYDIRP